MTSQAMDCTWARSKGGKGGLAAASGTIFQGEVPGGPSAPPAPDRDRVHSHNRSGLSVAKAGFPVQEANQGRPLALPGRHLALPDELLSLGKKLGRKGGLIGRRRAAHGRHPVATKADVSIQLPSIYGPTERRKPDQYL